MSRVAVLRPLPADVSAGATRTLGLGRGGREGRRERRREWMYHSLVCWVVLRNTPHRWQLIVWWVERARGGLITYVHHNYLLLNTCTCMMFLVTSLRVCIHQFTHHPCHHLPTTSHLNPPHTQSPTSTQLWYVPVRYMQYRTSGPELHVHVKSKKASLMLYLSIMHTCIYSQGRCMLYSIGTRLWKTENTSKTTWPVSESFSVTLC